MDSAYLTFAIGAFIVFTLPCVVALHVMVRFLKHDRRRLWMSLIITTTSLGAIVLFASIFTYVIPAIGEKGAFFFGVLSFGVWLTTHVILATYFYRVTLRRALLLTCVAGATVVVVALVLGMWRTASLPITGKALFPQEESTSTFSSKTTNTRFQIPSGWHLGTTTNIVVPNFFANPFAVLENDEEGCVLIYADLTALWQSSSYKQLSFADRVFSADLQFDGDWYVKDGPEAQKYSFSEYKRQYVPGEIRISNSLRVPSFALFSTEQRAVSDVCNRDMNSLIESLEYYFPAAPAFDASTSGIIDVKQQFDDHGPDDVSRVVFTPTGTTDTYELVRLPGLSSDRYIVMPDGKVYFPMNSYKKSGTDGYTFESAIWYFNPLSRTVGVVPGTKNNDTYIASLAYTGSGFQYLLMKGTEVTCLDSPRTCITDLYAISPDGTGRELLASGVRGSAIAGYTPDDGTTHVVEGWGDAGECSTSYVLVRGGESSTVPGGFESDCKFNLISDSVSSRFPVVRADSILLEGNKLLPGQSSHETETYWGTFEFAR